MEEVCPACNGLTSLSANCPFCGNGMTDAGSLGNYFGPYSPYMDEESLSLVTKSEETLPCVHLMTCPHCGWDTRIAVNHIFK